jgi:hypothetical protein
MLSIGQKPEGKRALRRCRPRWKENSEVDLKERGLEGMDRLIWFWTGTSGGLL